MLETLTVIFTTKFISVPWTLICLVCWGAVFRGGSLCSADVVVFYNQVHICGTLICLVCWEGPVFIPEFWLIITGTHFLFYLWMTY